MGGGYFTDVGIWNTSHRVEVQDERQLAMGPTKYVYEVCNHYDDQGVHETRLNLRIIGYESNCQRGRAQPICQTYELLVPRENPKFALNFFPQTLTDLGVTREQIIEAKDFQDV